MCLTVTSSALPTPWQVAHASPLPGVAMLVWNVARVTLIMPPLVAMWPCAADESWQATQPAANGEVTTSSGLALARAALAKAVVVFGTVLMNSKVEANAPVGTLA